MMRIVTTRYPPEDWNIYAAQASDGDNSSADNDRTCGAADRRRSCRSASISPISRSAARASTSTPELPRQRSACGSTYRHRDVGRAAGHAQGQRPARDLPGVPRAVRARAPPRSRPRHDRRHRPLCSTAPTGTSHDPARVYDACEADRARRAGARHLPEPDRGDHRRADARRLFLDRHAAVLPALVVRQAFRPRRGALPQGPAGPGLRDRDQLPTPASPTSWRRTP